MEPMDTKRLQASDFPQEVLDIFDSFVHGRIDRRAFLDSASKYAVVGGMTAQMMLDALKPNYRDTATIAKDDPRIIQEYIFFESPQGNGRTKAYMAKPSSGGPKWPAVLVIHENRGLNPYIEDVVRRMAAAGFLAIGPDALTSVGGYPGDDTKGAELQRTVPADKIRQDFLAGANYLATHASSTGNVGTVGFCFGGGVVNFLAWNMPTLKAAVPFYGAVAPAAEVPKINAAIQAHMAEMDSATTAWPAYKAALDAAGKKSEGFVYPGAQHGFHNNTTPRYNETAAKLAQDRFIQFFKDNLK
jgi:carboxymethylenebutenolidase